MIIIPILDFICLIGVIVSIVWWQKKHGRLTEKSMALIISCYGTFFIITSIHPIFLKTGYDEILIYELILLLVIWLLGYPFARWLYRQMNSKK